MESEEIRKLINEITDSITWTNSHIEYIEMLERRGLVDDTFQEGLAELKQTNIGYVERQKDILDRHFRRLDISKNKNFII